jgi:two-component system LytT family response regulator
MGKGTEAGLTALLVDDEPLANAGLRALLAAHPDIEVIGEALSGREAVRQIVTLCPALVFLDVQMPGLNGFGVLREVLRSGTAMPAVIFVTAYDEFAVRAFEVEALDYLMKPVEEARFRAALDRARESWAGQAPLQRARALEQRLRALLAEYEQETPAAARSRYLQRLMVSVGQRSVVVETSAIDWIGARDYCAELHVGDKTHVVRESLAALEASLDPRRFLRVHRSAIVNLARVRELSRRAVRGTAVVLADGSRVPVSRSQLPKLRELLGPTR